MNDFNKYQNGIESTSFFVMTLLVHSSGLVIPYCKFTVYLNAKILCTGSFSQDKPLF